MAGVGRPGPGPRAGMPAWKREVLERKRAKLAALSGGDAAGERLVLAESLGPLRENPFMRLESERRRQQRGAGTGAAGARPVQQLLELYRRVPGVRTIRADNILIIESVPGFPPAAPGPPDPPAATGLAARIRAAEVLVYEPPPPPGRVSRLLRKFDPPPAAPSAPSAPSRRGSPERARPPPAAAPPAARPPPAAAPRPPPAAAPPAARPPPAAAPRPPPAAAPPAPRPPPAAAPPAPRPPPAAAPRPPPQQQQQQPPPAPLGPACPEPERRGPGPGARRSDFVQKTGHNSFTVHPRGLLHRPLLPNGPAAPAGAANGPAGSSRGPAAAVQPKVGSGEPPATPPASPGTPSATTAASAPAPASAPASPRPSPASATPSQRRWVSAATSANDSFEIRPACKPDLEAIPAGDLRARALASLRVNSRHSFVFIPKRPAAAATSSTSTSTSTGRPAGQRGGGGGAAQPGSGADGRAPVPERRPWRAPERACPRPATAPVDPAARWPRPCSPPPSPSLRAAAAAEAEAEPSQGFGVPGPAKNGGEPGRPGLPVTFIDEVDSEDEVPQEAKLPARHHQPSERPLLAAAAGNTFTVVPKRKPGALQANGEPGALEADCLAEPPNALKKRYPTVHEIEVIGGYLALQKSCLTKAGSSRKKMKISFNDKSLHTTFEYPSESSLVQEAQAEAEGEEADEEEDDEEEEEGGSGLNGAVEKPFALFLPRATFVNSVAPDSPRLPDGSSGLSSYTPKHSVSFSKWQEQPLAQAPGEVEPSLKEVMLTPACPNALSDFRSEPALYF